MFLTEFTSLYSLNDTFWLTKPKRIQYLAARTVKLVKNVFFFFLHFTFFHLTVDSNLAVSHINYVSVYRTVLLTDAEISMTVSM